MKTREPSNADVVRFRLMPIGELMRAAAELLEEQVFYGCIGCGESMQGSPGAEKQAIALVLEERADEVLR